MPPQESPEPSTGIAPDAAVAPGLKNRGLNDAPLGPKFSLRALLIATAASATVALFLGYGYRAVNLDARPAFLLFWGALLGVLMLYLGLHAFRSWQRRRIVGTIRFSLTRVNGPRPSFAALLFGWGLCMFALLTSYMFTNDLTRDRGGAVKGAIPSGVMQGLMIAAGLHLLYRPFTRAWPIRLGDDGLIVGDRPMPWTNVAAAEWNVLNPSQLQLSTWHERPYVVEVPGVCHEPLESFLKERTHFAT